MWGSNSFGQFGNGTTEDSDIPIKIMDDLKNNISTDVTTDSSEICTSEIKVSSNLEMHNANDEVLMTIRTLKNIRVEPENYYDTSSQYYCVIFELLEDDRTKFAEITRNMVGENLSIYIDDTNITSPEVSSAIEDGVVCIAGPFSYDDAQRLVSLLRDY